MKKKNTKLQVLKTKKAGEGSNFALCKFWKSQKILKCCREVSSFTT